MEDEKKAFLAVIAPVSTEMGDYIPHPEHPIYFPPNQPEHPIVLPPEGGNGGGEGETDPPHPDHTLPGDLPHPEHPIELPPEVGEIERKFEIKVAWTEEDGWFVALIPNFEHATPSRKRK